MPKWTPDQQTAIDDRGGALLVSAAAGSGKTAVLTERVLRRLTDENDPVDIDRLLLVTFTNAAAAEMRERIAAAIASGVTRSVPPTAAPIMMVLTMLAPNSWRAMAVASIVTRFFTLSNPGRLRNASAGSVELMKTEPSSFRPSRMFTTSSNVSSRTITQSQE